MTVQVNLLPESYRKARRHEKWFRRGVAIWGALMAVELCGGLVLYLRAGEKRDLLEAADKARNATEALKQELTETTRQATLIRKNIALAKELRATHRWSRLLASLAQATPEGVILSSIATDPPKWSRAKQQARLARKPKGKRAQAEARAEPAGEPPIKGTSISGYAADHEGLSQFLSALHASELFEAIDLQRMRRDQLQGQEAVSFELQGSW